MNYNVVCKGCGEEESETEKETQTIYLHERVKPRAAPSAGRWDWPICTQSQRSGGRGLDNLIGRDWSLSRRHHLGKRTKTVNHLGNHKYQTNKQQSRSIYTVHAVTLLCSRSVCLCVWVAQSMRADVSVPENSAVITLLLSHHALHFNKTVHRQTALRKKEGQLMKPPSQNHNQGTMWCSVEATFLTGNQ